MIRINRTVHLHLVGKVGEQIIVHVSVHRGKVTLLFINRQQQILSTNTQPSVQEEDKNKNKQKNKQKKGLTSCDPYRIVSGPEEEEKEEEEEEQEEEKEE